MQKGKNVIQCRMTLTHCRMLCTHHMQVGVVVNDVAAVNIDAKLIRERSSSGIQTKSGEGVEFVELENGCACCNASGELLACVDQLLEIASVRGYAYDRIIIEMSGVGEPRNVRAEFHEALREGHPIFEKVQLCTMITVVDSPHFFRLYRYNIHPLFSTHLMLPYVWHPRTSKKSHGNS
jgi:G3E family GTPase